MPPSPIGPASSSKPRPGYKYHVFLSLCTLHTLHPALEDGTDRGFRNVGKLQSDAGEIPKRIHTIFKTRRKSEIKNGSFSFFAFSFCASPVSFPSLTCVTLQQRTESLPFLLMPQFRSQSCNLCNYIKAKIFRGKSVGT